MKIRHLAALAPIMLPATAGADELLSPAAKDAAAALIRAQGYDCAEVVTARHFIIGGAGLVIGCRSRRDATGARYFYDAMPWKMTPMQISDNIFVPPEGELPEHYAAIGRLIIRFADIERALAASLRELVGATHEVGNALLGEMRAKDAIRMFVRVLDARRRDEMIASPDTGIPFTMEELPVLLASIRKGDLPPNLGTKARLPSRVARQTLFVEIERLNDVRDDIAHRQMFVHGREMTFSNLQTARTPDRAHAEIYSIDDLNDMSSYAEKLAKRVRLLLHPPSAVEAELARDPTLLEIPARLRPPGKPHQSRRERRPERAPPRPSSRA
jgi:hypothetical protein